MAEVTGRLKWSALDGTRLADVDTGFWLWLDRAAAVDDQQTRGLRRGGAGDRKMVVVATTFLTVGLGVIVLTFLLLMRSGYKWTRTLLTAGGVATIVYTAVTLLGVVRDLDPGGDLRGDRHHRFGAHRRRHLPAASARLPRVLHPLNRLTS